MLRTIHWLFIVGAALFVFGIGFVVVGAREARRTPVAASAAAPTLTPVASTKQIMSAIVGPAADAIFNAVSTTVTAKGIEEVFPRNDEEWSALGSKAAALAEAGNLILVEGRAVDQGDWVKMSRAMIDAGKLTLKAVEGKSTEGILTAGEAVNETCDNCHERYRRD
jgi:hypothetical protein